MCGDATKAEDVAKLMGGSKTSFISCDPPYNIGLDYSKASARRESTKGALLDAHRTCFMEMASKT